MKFLLSLVSIAAAWEAETADPRDPIPVSRVSSQAQCDLLKGDWADEYVFNSEACACFAIEQCPAAQCGSGERLNPLKPCECIQWWQWRSIFDHPLDASCTLVGFADGNANTNLFNFYGAVLGDVIGVSDDLGGLDLLNSSN